MSKKTWIIAVTVVVLIVAVIFFSRPTPTHETENQEVVTNFTSEGTLVRDDPGLKPGVWYLLQENPGGAAVSTELRFGSQSVCSSKTCVPTELTSGTKVRIEGYREVDDKTAGTDVILVQNLTIPNVATSTNTDVKLYYYRPALDADANGEILCSKQGASPVIRNIPRTMTPAQDVIKLLLRGEITAEEKASGLTTEFPLPGVTLKGASLKNGVLTLEFTDPNAKTSGGSCRVAILWAQIEATAKQFPTVKSVRFMPEELFQP